MPDSPPPRPRPADPIAWAAVEPLARRAQEIAKGWLLLLLERAPLDAVGAIPAAALAAEGPALCNAFVRALGSEVELDRLRPDGDLAAVAGRVGPLAGALDGGAVIAAVDALRACVWAEARGEQEAAAAQREVDALAERLATVTAVVAATAVGALAAGAGETAAPTAEEPAATEALHTPALAPAASSSPNGGSAPRGGGQVPVAPQHGVDGPVASRGAAETALDGAAEPAVRDLREDAPGEAASVTPLPPRPREDAASAMDDADLWLATLERHVDRCRREGGGLALLRVELVDAEHVLMSAPEDQVGVPYGRLAQAIRRAIRRQDLVAADHQGRAWVIAPGVGRAGAIALAERIGAGVEHGESWRGAPLAATIGFAIYGEDGRDAATLLERAEEAMLAASAAGVRIGEAIPQPDAGGDRPPGPRLVR